MDKFVGIFGSVPPGSNDPDTLVRVGVGAVRAGFAIVVDRPLSKIPMCTLTARDRKKADEEAQAKAKDAGNPRWQKVRHECGLKHALTSDTEAMKILKRLTKDGDRVNLGLELHASRMVVVDVDTAEENAAFLEDWEAQGGRPISMTVQSPGVLDSDSGEWVHSEGGHYWFEVPEGVELPRGTGAMKVELSSGGSYTLMWAARQVLVPPAVREEGPYRLVGQVNKLPSWISDKIYMEVDARRVRAEERLNRARSGDYTELDEWSAVTPWDEILGPDGWTATGMPDGCSCLIWTAPGSHASPKSATAHDAGCSHYDTTEGHGPLHLWTDNPPEYLIGKGKTMTKLQYLAYRDHDGQIAPVLRDLGIGRGDGGDLSPFESRPIDRVTEEEINTPLPELPKTGGLTALGSEVTARRDPDTEVDDDYPADAVDNPAIETEVDPVLQRAMDLKARLKTSEQLEYLEDPEPLVEGLLDLDTFARITGKSNHGKSFVMLDLAACVAMDRPWHGHAVKQGMVVYMVAEGARGWKKRLRAWEHRYNNGEYIPGDRLMVLDAPVQTTNKQEWDAWRMVLKSLDPVLVIMDTQARITVSVNENDAREMGEFVERIEMVRRDTGACVAVVHHLGHSGDQGRGSSAVLGAINTELRVVKTKHIIKVEVEKQKDESFEDPLLFTLEDEDYGVNTSAVLVSVDQDPYDNMGQLTDKSPAVDRMAALLYKHFSVSKGATEAQIKGLAMDQKTELAKMSKATAFRVWKNLLEDEKVERVIDEEGKLTQRYVLVSSEIRRLGLDGSIPTMQDARDDDE